MRRFKEWLWKRFLPEYGYQSMLEERARLQAKISQQAQEIEQLSAYIDGMEAGMRSLRRITINNHSGGEAE